MKLFAACALACLAGAANAQVVDGQNFTAEYGPSLWAQNIGTGFGNSTDPSPVFSNGSEIDSLYARIVGGTLYVGVAGNLETNFNKLNLALDFRPGGQNTLQGLPNLGNMDGLTFDAGFEADVVLSYTNGNSPSTGSGEFEHYLDGANIGGGGGFLGGGTRSSIGDINAVLDGASITVDSNHLNTGGVNSLGNPFDSDPSLVDTGVEWLIDLAALGWDGVTPIKIAGFVNGGGNDFLSNQVIGGLPDGTGNLGGDGSGGYIGNLAGINFNNFAGDQFVVIVPAPGSLALLGVAGLCLRRRR